MRVALCFEILAVEPEKIYERRGRIQRITGHINRELFHHPDALRIPESMFSGLVEVFSLAHAKFNYYGPTEYQRDDIPRLCKELAATVGAASTSGCSRVKPHDIVQSIIAMAEEALSKGQSLLVFGI